MPGTICIVCEKNLTLDEEDICAQCELSNDNGKNIETHIVNCGCCSVIVEEDSEGLYCNVCDRWFHNACCENPLIEDLYGLLNAAPNNIKWFCDKCIWITEKWIKSFSTITNNERRGRTRRLNTAVNSFKTFLEPYPEYDYTKERDVKIEIQDEDMPFGFDGSQSTGFEKYEVRKKVKKENKQQRTHIIDTNEKPYEYSKQSLERHSSVHTEYDYTKEPDVKIEIQDKDMPFGFNGSQSTDSEEYEVRKKVKKENKQQRTHIIGTNEKHYKCSKQSHEEKQYQCNECDYTFKHKQSLERHSRVNCSRLHTGDKYQCNHCNKSYTIRKSLKCHLVTHSGEKPYVCSKCNKAFSQKSHLTRHLKVHTGDKPYKCSECDYATSEIQSLKKHNRIHTGEKLYQCTICEKTFATISNYTAHQQIHTREKLYQCTLSDKTFSENSALKIPMQIHKGNTIRYKCSNCEKTFSLKNNLKNHLQNKH